jgi:arylsulfatase A-like enzyme
VGLLSCTPGLEKGAGGASQPNIVLITADTLRADHLGCYGNGVVETPNVDRLARDGTLFGRAVAQAQNTNPAVSSILTGLYAREHGVYDNRTRLRDRHRTLAEALRGVGYRTAGFVSARHLNAKHSGFGQGFDDFQPCDAIERKAGETTDLVLDWLKRRRREPFFLWIHYFDPHMPYLPPPPFGRKYYRGSPRDPRNHSMEEVAFPEGAGGYYLDWLSGVTDIAYPRAQYLGEVSYLDSEVGRLLDGLRKYGLYADSLIIFVADHGESHGEHGVYFDHAGLHEAVVHVPLIIKAPGDAGGRRVDRLVESRAIFSTLVGVAEGSDRPASLLRDPGEDGGERAVAFSEHNRHLAVSIHRGDLHYVLELRDDDTYPRRPFRAGAETLFDLSTDPAERENLAESGDPRLAELRRHVEAWTAGHGAE